MINLIQEKEEIRMLQSINLSEIQKLNVLPESDVMKTYNHRIYTLQDGDTLSF